MEICYILARIDLRWADSLMLAIDLMRHSMESEDKKDLVRYLGIRNIILSYKLNYKLLFSRMVWIM